MAEFSDVVKALIETRRAASWNGRLGQIVEVIGIVAVMGCPSR